MTAQNVLDVSHLPAHSLSSRAPLWWGQLALIAIEATMFGICFASYFYLRLGVGVWPPPGDYVPHLPIATVALVVFLLSCWPAYLASEAAKQNNRRGVILWMILNVLMGLVFVALRVVEWRQFNYQWDTDVYGSIVWTILGLHTFDTGALLVESIVLLCIFLWGRVGEKQRLGIHVDSLTWYCIVLVWIPLYFLIYLIGPRVLGT